MRLHPRARNALAWLLWLATMACCVAGLVVTLFVTRPLTAGVRLSGAAFAVAFPLGYATIGLVMALRRPANPIGWLFAVSGLLWSITIPFDPWLDQLILDGRPLPLLAKLDAIATEYNWAPAIAFGITLPALLVPDGRLRSPRWRPVVAAAVAGPVLGLLGSTFMQGKLEESVVPIDNPFGRTGMAGTVAAVVGFTGLGLWFTSMLAALVSLVLRFRASRGTERQQLRWVVAGAVGAVAGLVIGIAGVVVTYFAVLCLPVGVGVAVLRYRLWDLDRLVSRFRPLRRRVQDLVDRRFNRRRHDAARIVEAFGARLRDQVDLGALHAELLAVVDQNMQPTQASLWLRPPTPQRAGGA